MHTEAEGQPIFEKKPFQILLKKPLLKSGIKFRKKSLINILAYLNLDFDVIEIIEIEGRHINY